MNLKSCPFCGNAEQEKLREFTVGEQRAVECAACGAHGPMQNTTLYAQLGWELRATETHKKQSH